MSEFRSGQMGEGDGWARVKRIEVGLDGRKRTARVRDVEA
jgi:hypothetical protein